MRTEKVVIKKQAPDEFYGKTDHQDSTQDREADIYTRLYQIV